MTGAIAGGIAAGIGYGIGQVAQTMRPSNVDFGWEREFSLAAKAGDKPAANAARSGLGGILRSIDGAQKTIGNVSIRFESDEIARTFAPVVDRLGSEFAGRWSDIEGQRSLVVRGLSDDDPFWSARGRGPNTVGVTLPDFASGSIQVTIRMRKQVMADQSMAMLVFGHELVHVEDYLKGNGPGSSLELAVAEVRAYDWTYRRAKAIGAAASILDGLKKSLSDNCTIATSSTRGVGLVGSLCQ